MAKRKQDAEKPNCSTCINGSDIGNYMIQCKFLKYANPYNWHRCDAGGDKYKKDPRK